MNPQIHSLLETWQQNRDPQLLAETLSLMESETARIVKEHEENGRTFGSIIESSVMIGLARELSEALWQQPEEDAAFSRALHCWRNVVFATANELATMGPLMLQYAAWQLRKGDTAKAEGVYWAIAQDFIVALEEAEEILEEDTSNDPTWKFASNDPQLYRNGYPLSRRPRRGGTPRYRAGHHATHGKVAALLGQGSGAGLTARLPTS